MGVSESGSSRRTALVTEETRELILKAAEIEFATRGFAAARLEDIAERVGITRAAIIYHFRDKQALYDAALEAAFTPLTERIRAALETEASHAERIEAMIEAWIDYAAERPTLARLFMREVASSEGELRPEVRRLADPMYSLVLEGIKKGQNEGAFRRIDPVHLVSILAGATMWFVTDAPLLERQESATDSDPERLAAYREELLGVTRFLLGTDAA